MPRKKPTVFGDKADKSGPKTKAELDPDFVDRTRRLCHRMTINKLSDEALVEVYWLLRSNSKQWSYRAIARHIQKKLGELTELDEGWLCQQLTRFKSRVVGRGRPPAALVRGELVAPERSEKEMRSAKELSEIDVLGDRILSLQTELDYWIADGRRRGIPHDKYIPELMKQFMIAAKQRHEMKVVEGRVKTARKQLDVNITEASVALFGSVGDDDTEQMTTMIGAFKRRLEGLARDTPGDEPPIDITPDTNEIRLLPEMDSDGDGTGSPECVDVGTETQPETSGNM